jgi:hypothetical protein
VRDSKPGEPALGLPARGKLLHKVARRGKGAGTSKKGETRFELTAGPLGAQH